MAALEDRRLRQCISGAMVDFSSIAIGNLCRARRGSPRPNQQDAGCIAVRGHEPAAVGESGVGGSPEDRQSLATLGLGHLVLLCLYQVMRGPGRFPRNIPEKIAPGAGAAVDPRSSRNQARASGRAGPITDPRAARHRSAAPTGKRGGPPDLLAGPARRPEPTARGRGPDPLRPDPAGEPLHPMKRQRVFDRLKRRSPAEFAGRLRGSGLSLRIKDCLTRVSCPASPE